MPGTFRDLQPQVLFNGTVLEDVLSFRWSLGYDNAVGDATIVCVNKSGAGTYYDDVTIVVDGTSRWSGLLYQWDYSLWPRSVSMVCKGRLQLAQDFKLPDEYSREAKGLQLATLMGATSPTDQNIVSAVLTSIGLDTLGGVISGTGTVLGTIAPETFVWAASDSALAYIQKIDAISLGYRTFESAGGAIFRSQISSRPSGAADYTFTEGEDIMEGSSSRTVQDAYSGVRVGGYSVGDYADPRVWFQADGSDFNSRVFDWSNEMVERRADASSGLGFSCQSEAVYWLTELNREIVKVTMRTPRSDVFGPGQIHLVQAAGGLADRLGVGEKLWVQRCDGELRPDGSFSQSLTYIGGGV